jgi:hypothetical protein
MISDDELKKLEDALASATPGPWWNDGLLLMIPDEPGGNVCGKRMIDMGGEVADNNDFWEEAEYDAAFVQLARNRMADLLAEIRRWRALAAMPQDLGKN